jgi:hypothetical protein
MTPQWVSVVALLAWLILVGSALRARHINARKGVVYALIWGSIFLAAALIFGAIG